MTVRRNKLGRAVLGVGLSASMLTAPAFAQNAPLDPYPVAAPTPPPPPPAPPAPPSNGGNVNQNNINANPTNTVTANPTNTNNNDNRSTATVTNNNTIYIYPPSLPPPAPPQASMTAPPLLPPPLPPPTAISPPPLVPPPAVRYGYPPRPQRIRLNCAQLCALPPAPVSPVLPRERIRVVGLGASFTVLGMANQPFAGWGTLYGGGVQLNIRSRGRFGFEISQDFLRGELRSSDNGPSFTRQSYPFQFTLKGYILPNLDRYHFNMYFGGGLGAMASNIDVPLGNNDFATQHFLEWMIHADVGAELRFKWFALGADARITGLVRDRNYGDGAYYGDIQNGPVPAATWGVQGRAFMNFWF